MKKILFPVVLLCCIGYAAPVLGWGIGHETIARETLRVLPGKWGERLRAGEGGRLFLKYSHAPDDIKTKLEERSAYLDEELRTRLPGPNGAPAVMYRLHSADARCELIRAMARAMKADNEVALGFLLANFCHSVADTVSANHSPLVQLVCYNWKPLGLTDAVADDCSALDQTPAGRVLLRKACNALDLAWTNAAPASVWSAAFRDELVGTEYFRYDMDIVSGGEPALRALAAEAVFAVRRTCEALQAAERFAAMPTIPTVDAKAEAARFTEEAHRFLSARDGRTDSLTRGLWPAPGDVPGIGVVYDPTGFWTRGIVYMANRAFAAQICTTLRKAHGAGLLDIRELMAKGVPTGVKTLVVPGSGLGDHLGFAAADALRAFAAFLKTGGRLVWIGGSPQPPADLFPEGRAFVKNPAANPWGHMRGPVAAVDMPGGSLVLPDGRRFTCRRAPKGTAGWYWGQLGLDYLPPSPLPEEARELLAFETGDGKRMPIGYSIANRVFLPAFALYPFVFTDETPSVMPLRLELDAAGEAVLLAALAHDQAFY